MSINKTDAFKLFELNPHTTALVAAQRRGEIDYTTDTGGASTDGEEWVRFFAKDAANLAATSPADDWIKGLSEVTGRLSRPATVSAGPVEQVVSDDLRGINEVVTAAFEGRAARPSQYFQRLVKISYQR